MLHENVLMADIDVDQWRNAQALLLRSAKAARRLVVLHDGGAVVKFRHSAGAPVTGRVDTVTDPHELARALYEANRDAVDLVVVMERSAVDACFSRVQDSWDIDEDLDVFVRRTYALLDEFGDGIVTHPGPARSTLGLQWRVGAPFEAVDAAVRAHVPAGSTVVLAVHDADRLWASLVLDFDGDRKVTSVTTADPSLVDVAGDRARVLDRLVAWQAGRGKTVSVALSFDRAAVDDLLDAPAADKGSVIAGLLAAGRATAA